MEHRRRVFNRVDQDTVARWFNRWEQLGIVGLGGRTRSGRPEKPTLKEQERVRQLFKAHARAPKQIGAAITQETGRPVSVDTLKRIGKKSRLCWKRIRRSLKDKRDRQAFEQSKEDVKILRTQGTRGEIDQYFFDVSGFSLTLFVP